MQVDQLLDLEEKKMTQKDKHLLKKKMSFISVLLLSAGIYVNPVKVVAQNSSKPSFSESLSSPEKSPSSDRNSCSFESSGSTNTVSCATQSHSNSNDIKGSNTNSSGSSTTPSFSQDKTDLNPGLIALESKPESNSTLLKPTNNPFDSATDENIPQPNDINSSTSDQSKPSTDSSVQPNNISSPPSIESQEITTQYKAERQKELSIEKNIADKINSYRKQKGLTPLKLDSDISKSAQAHSLEMADKEVPVGHQGFKIRVKMLRQEFNLKSAAENVAYNQGYEDPATQAIEGWLKSPEHKKNIEGNYNLTGIGVAKDKQGRIFLTQIFVFGSKNQRPESTNTSEKPTTKPGEEDNNQDLSIPSTEPIESNLSEQTNSKY